MIDYRFDATRGLRVVFLGAAFVVDFFFVAAFVGLLAPLLIVFFFGAVLRPVFFSALCFAVCFFGVFVIAFFVSRFLFATIE